MKKRFVGLAIISALIITLFAYAPIKVSGADGGADPYAELMDVPPDQFTPEALLALNGPDYNGEYSYRKNGRYGFWEAWFSVGVMDSDYRYFDVLLVC